MPNKSHMFLPSPSIDFSVQCLDSLPPSKIYRPKVEGWPRSRQHPLLPAPVPAKTPALTFLNLYFSTLCSFSAQSQNYLLSMYLSHFHRKASNSPPPACSDKILAVHMVDKAQKKMTFYPELICVDHDNGHWCLRSVLAPITQCRWILFRAWHGSVSYLLFFSRMFFLRKHVSTQTSYFLLRQCPSTPLHHLYHRTHRLQTRMNTEGIC